MLPGQPKQDDITFSSVALKGGLRIVYIVLIVFIVVMMIAADYLSNIAPRNYKGETEYQRFDVVVPDTTEPPLKLTVSHDYPIYAQVIGFYITEGPDLIEYQISVCNTAGQVVYDKSSSMMMPDTISAYSGSSTYTVSEVLEIDIPPGNYRVNLISTHPVEYSLAQTYKYQAARDASIALSILAIILLIAVTIIALRKRDSLRAQRSYAMHATPTTGYGIITEPGSGPTYEPSQPMYGQTMAYYPTAEEPVDYVCAKCGNLIQNPVVQNVITCERCGEREYVQ